LKIWEGLEEYMPNGICSINYNLCTVRYISLEVRMKMEDKIYLIEYILVQKNGL